tara:strand:+ start:264 stop:740 length:477 start_codon:yes stop_codon:yes gene_type:complete
MKNIYLKTLMLFFVVSLFSCKVQNINKMTGYEEVETGMEARKYKDIEGETYYAIVVGEHGDEGTAKRYAISQASVEFGKKAEAMIEAAFKQETGQSMRNKVGTLDIEERNTVISRACTNDMIMVEDKLYYNQDTRIYQYRAVYRVKLENIVKKVLDGI